MQCTFVQCPLIKVFQENEKPQWLCTVQSSKVIENHQTNPNSDSYYFMSYVCFILVNNSDSHIFVESPLLFSPLLFLLELMLVTLKTSLALVMSLVQLVNNGVMIGRMFQVF